MKALIDGIFVELTPEQIKMVEKEKRRRAACRNSFEKMLRHFKFKKVDTSTWENPDQLCYEHVYYEWFAVIISHANWFECELVGKGFPMGWFGGKLYEEPEDVQKAIEEAIEYCVLNQ